MIGDAQGDLSENGLTASPGIELTTPCNRTGRFYELVLDIAAGNKDTKSSGFVIQYTVGKSQSKLFVPFETHSCAARTSDVCQGLPPPPQ